MEYLGDEIRQLTEAVWTSSLLLPIEFGGDGARDAELLHGCVHVAGEWNGTLVLSCAQPLAHRIAQSMFALGPEQVGASHLRDALGEVTNMVGGNVKSLLPGVSHLSLPTVVEPADAATKLPAGKLLTTVRGMSDGAVFEVRLFERAARVAR